jgi:hypothetical protein
MDLGDMMLQETALGNLHHNAQKATSSNNMAAYMSKYQMKPPVQSKVRELDGKILPGSYSSKDLPEGKIMRELAVVQVGFPSMVMRLHGRGYTGSFSSTCRAVITLPISMEGKEWGVVAADGSFSPHKKQQYFDRNTDTRWRTRVTYFQWFTW